MSWRRPREMRTLTSVRHIAALTACGLVLGVWAGSLSAEPQAEKPGAKSHPAAKVEKTARTSTGEKTHKPEIKQTETKKDAKHKASHKGHAPASSAAHGGATRVSTAGPAATPPPAASFTAPVKSG